MLRVPVNPEIQSQQLVADRLIIGRQRPRVDLRLHPRQGGPSNARRQVLDRALHRRELDRQAGRLCSDQLRVAEADALGIPQPEPGRPVRHEGVGEAKLVLRRAPARIPEPPHGDDGQGANAGQGESKRGISGTHGAVNALTISECARAGGQRSLPSMGGVREQSKTYVSLCATHRTCWSIPIFSSRYARPTS